MSLEDQLKSLQRLRDKDRQARKTAERLLEAKSRELYAVNDRLMKLADELEQRVSKRTTELASRNSLLSSLLENIQSGILYSDPRENGILVNRFLLELFGLENESIDCDSLSKGDFIGLIGDQFSDFDQLQESTRELSAARLASNGEEWELIDGRHLSRDFLPLYDNGEYQGEFWLYTDVSYRKELEESRAQAEAGMEAKSVFLANMSHEIRTPLNGIIGMNRLLMDQPLSAKQMQYAQAMRDSSDSLLRIINDILDFSKVEAGKLDFEIIDFSILETVDAVVELLQVKAANKDIDLNVIFDPRIPAWLKGDPSRIRQVLLNLVGNAVKFTHEGYVLVKVSCDAVGSQSVDLCFDILDTGIGISKGDKQRLFEPFSQAEPSIGREFGGTGLGLAISSSLVRLMGGSIDVESREAGGSTFSVRIPFQTGTAPAGRGRVFEGSDIACLVTAESAQLRESLMSMLRVEGIDRVEAFSLDQIRELSSSAFRQSHVLWLVLHDSDTEEETLDLLEKTSDFLSPLVLSRIQKMNEPSMFDRYDTMGLPLNRKSLIRRIANRLGVKCWYDSSANVSAESLKEIRLDQMRILLAEDNSINQQVQKTLLEGLGANVDIAASGLEVLRMLERLSYDLILMDIRMPEMDGVEACKRIRASGDDTPIVALTANAMKGDRETYIEAGMNDYISKPLSRSDLTDVLLRLFSSQVEGRSEKREDEVPENAVLDYDALLYTVGGNAPIANEVIREFCKQYKESLKVGYKAIDEEDWDSARAAFHRLSGSCGAIEAREMAKAAGDVELLMRKGPNKDDVLKQTMTKLKTAVRRFEAIEKNLVNK